MTTTLRDLRVPFAVPGTVLRVSYFQYFRKSDKTRHRMSSNKFLYGVLISVFGYDCQFALNELHSRRFCLRGLYGTLRVRFGRHFVLAVVVSGGGGGRGLAGSEMT
jgi:hypothetical protein